MYHQIARNKRNSLIVVVLFVLFWLLAGFVVGEFGGGNLATAVGGAIILGILGICAALYSYYLGSATVLSARKVRPSASTSRVAQSLTSASKLL